MARPLRLEFAGALYYVTARRNERRDIFLEIYLGSERFIESAQALIDPARTLQEIPRKHAVRSRNRYLILQNMTPSATRLWRKRIGRVRTACKPLPSISPLAE